LVEANVLSFIVFAHQLAYFLRSRNQKNTKTTHFIAIK